MNADFAVSDNAAANASQVDRISFDELIDDGCTSNYILLYDGFSARVHMHDCFELSVVLGGTAKITLNGAETFMRRGDIQLIRPYEPHFKADYDKSMMYSFVVSVRAMKGLITFLNLDECMTDIIRGRKFLRASLSDGDRDGYIRRLKEISGRFHDGDYYATLEVKTVFAQLMICFFRHQPSAGKSPDWLRELTGAACEPAVYVPGVAELTRRSGKTHCHLCRAFKQYLDMTPTQYINSIRVESAAKLLAETECSVTRVAMDSGFLSISNFYSCFAKTYGVSPQAYRDMNMGGKKL